jgi:hypothetical protein
LSPLLQAETVIAYSGTVQLPGLTTADMANVPGWGAGKAGSIQIPDFDPTEGRLLAVTETVTFESELLVSGQYRYPTSVSLGSVDYTWLIGSLQPTPPLPSQNFSALLEPTTVTSTVCSTVAAGIVSPCSYMKDPWAMSDQYEGAGTWNLPYETSIATDDLFFAINVPAASPLLTVTYQWDTPPPTPEPSTWVLLGSGAMMLLCGRGLYRTRMR